MSFLDSVLSSIGTGGSTPAATISKPVPAKKLESTPSVSAKRKAEDELGRSVDRPAKIERTTTSKPVDRVIKNVPPSKQNGATQAVSSPAVAAVLTSNKNPKKGSFAAIMAKAKEAKTAPAAVTGTIMHKPKEKSRSRKDIVQEREAAKKATKKGIPMKNLQISREASTKEGNKKSVVETKPSTASKSGYQGTMKSSTVSTYGGTSKSTYKGTASAGKSRDSSASRSQQGPARRRIEYDDSDDYGNDDQDDYESEDYSDMDAGFDDMEDEEEQAERIARKEDAAAHAELERLKREKERKKASLLKGKH